MNVRVLMDENTVVLMNVEVWTANIVGRGDLGHNEMLRERFVYALDVV